MSKMRVHELAKELEIKSADIVTALEEKGMEVKAQSSIDEEQITYVKQKFSKNKTEEVKEEKKEERREKREERKEREEMDFFTRQGKKSYLYVYGSCRLFSLWGTIQFPGDIL